MQPDIVKFSIEDMFDAVRHSLGIRFIEGLRDIDIHADSLKDESEYYSGSCLGREMNALALHICKNQGLNAEIDTSLYVDSNTFSLFRPNGNFVLPDTIFVMQLYDESAPIMEQIRILGTGRRTPQQAEELNARIRPIMEQVHGQSKYDATDPYEKEYLYLEELFRKVKMFNHAYFLSFNEKHDPTHQCTSISQVYNQLRGISFKVESGSEDRDELGMHPYSRECHGEVDPNSRLSRAIEDLHKIILETVQFQFPDDKAPEYFDDANGYHSVNRVEKYSRLNKVFARDE